MDKEPMTSKERWTAVLNGETPDRVPTFYRATNEFTAKLAAYLGCSGQDELYDRLHIDKTVTVSPAYVGPPIPPEQDVFGTRYQNIDYGGGYYREAVQHPLARFSSVEEIEENYTWPEVDWYDFSVVPGQIDGKEEYVVRGGGSEPFLTYCNLRGREQAYMDLIINPEIVHYSLDRLFGLRYETTARIYETIPGRVMITTVAEDLGAQNGLLMSPVHIEEFLLPRMKRMMDLAHEAGAKVLFHSDGAIREILPTMIATGVDILDPVQWRCPGMEREALKEDFAASLVFHGAMDNQQTLPFGSKEDVVQEARDNLRLLGVGGGYIFGPCHNIQVVSDPENIVEMYEIAFREGRY